jgi:hypothetical protein
MEHVICMLAREGKLRTQLVEIIRVERLEPSRRLIARSSPNRLEERFAPSP